VTSGTAQGEINNQINTVTKLQSLVNRLGRDRAFAAELLALSKKNDTSGIAALWSKEMSGGQFQVRELKDWYFWGIFEDTAGCKYEVCFGTGCKGAPIQPMGCRVSR